MPNCKTKAQLLEVRKERALTLVIEPEFAIVQNAFNRGYQDAKQMVGMSSETAKSMRRNFLRAVHPDKFDTSQMTEAERTNWHLMMNCFGKVLTSLEDQIRYAAENSAGVTPDEVEAH